MGLFFTFINFYLLVVRFNTVTTSLRKETQKNFIWVYFSSSHLLFFLLTRTMFETLRRSLLTLQSNSTTNHTSIKAYLRCWDRARFWKVCWDWKLDEWENIQRKSFDATTINDFFLSSSCWWFVVSSSSFCFSPVWRKLRSIDCFWLARRHQKSNSARATNTKIMLYFSVSSSSFWMRKSIAIYVCGVYIGESMSSTDQMKSQESWEIEKCAKLIGLLNFLLCFLFRRLRPIEESGRVETDTMKSERWMKQEKNDVKTINYQFTTAPPPSDGLCAWMNHLSFLTMLTASLSAHHH